MQSEVLPSELQLVPPPTVPQARSYMFRQQSENTEYNLSRGERIRINIPRLQRSYLMKDSYIRFRVNIDYTQVANAGLTLDRCGAYGFFDRIEVYDYLGGTLLEQTQNIPALATLLGDVNNNLTLFNTKLQSTQGYEGSNVQAGVGELDKYELRTCNSGMVIIPFGTTGTADGYLSLEFSLPVLSFLGIFSDKYIPLHNGFSVDFFLNDIASSFVSRTTAANAATITMKEVWISNFEYCCQVLELGELAESMVMATNPFVIHSTQYRYFSDVILGGGNQSSFRMDLNLNVVSLRNIRFNMRPTDYNSFSNPTYGHRIRNFLQNFNLQYGSSYLPEIAGITCRSSIIPGSRAGYSVNASIFPGSSDYFKASGNSQSYMELSKTVDDNNEMSINWGEYRIDLGSTSVSNYAGTLTALVPTFGPDSGMCGKFAAGIDTRLNKKKTISGIDTNGLLVSINGQFDRDLINSMVQSTLDVWAEYDSFLNIIPGVATTTTF